MRSMIFVVAGLAACATSSNEQPQVEETGAALSVDYFGDTDVVGFRFTVTEVACPGESVGNFGSKSFDVDLVDGIFPGNVSLDGMQFDNDSRHLGADLFVSLPAGCYDVVAQPVSSFDGADCNAISTQAVADGGAPDVCPSGDCSVASVDGVKVEDGLTTETAPLISQCVGDPIGALDVLVLLNHPPQVKVAFDDGEEKFAYECEMLKVCATAFDVDDDPIEFVWEAPVEPHHLFKFGPDLTVDAVKFGNVVGFEDGHRIWESCVEVTPQFTEEYELKVTVFDLLKDGTGRIEDTLDPGATPNTSNDFLSFPLYVNWIEDPLCFDDKGKLVPAEGTDIDRPYTNKDGTGACWITPAEKYYCGFACGYGDPLKPNCDVQEYVCDDGNLIEEKLYPECPTS